MRRVVVVLLVVTNAALGWLIWNARTDGPESRPVPVPDAAPGWSSLDAQARCDHAARLVTYRDRWPTRCRWRQPGEQLQGQAFPPPPGPPPFDDTHVQIYVAAEQTPEQIAHAIAHEWGHMHHTREPTFVAEWLAARGLPAATPWEVWTEDYAEVFAALFGPPTDGWQAPTMRPRPEELSALEARFFS